MTTTLDPKKFRLTGVVFVGIDQISINLRAFQDVDTGKVCAELVDTILHFFHLPQVAGQAAEVFGVWNEHVDMQILKMHGIQLSTNGAANKSCTFNLDDIDHPNYTANVDAWRSLGRPTGFWHETYGLQVVYKKGKWSFSRAYSWTPAVLPAEAVALSDVIRATREEF